LTYAGSAATVTTTITAAPPVKIPEPARKKSVRTLGSIRRARRKSACTEGGASDAAEEIAGAANGYVVEVEKEVCVESRECLLLEDEGGSTTTEAWRRGWE